jgi:hypothetical protein
MELLTFSQLVVQLLRHKETLEENGFTINLKQNENLYKDELVINKKINFKEFYFSTQPYLWNTHKQFSFSTNLSYKQFTFRINTTTGLPESYQNQSEMNNDLVPFANDIFHIFQVINEQLTDDIDFDSTNQWHWTGQDTMKF